LEFGYFVFGLKVANLEFDSDQTTQAAVKQRDKVRL